MTSILTQMGIDEITYVHSPLPANMHTQRNMLMSKHVKMKIEALTMPIKERFIEK